MSEIEVMENEVLQLLQLNANDEYAKDTLAPWIAKTLTKNGAFILGFGID